MQCMLETPMVFLRKYLDCFKKWRKFIQTNIKSLEQVNSTETVIKSENEEFRFENLSHQVLFQKNLQINW